jgi:ankyrin repeat protein
VNACKHNHKYSTLHFAALSGKSDVVRLLLTHGADPDATNTVGKTASQIGAFVGEQLSTLTKYFPVLSLPRALFIASRTWLWF